MNNQHKVKSGSVSSNNSSLSSPSSKNSVDGDVTLPKTETLRLRKKYLGSPCALYFQDDPIKIVRGKGQYLYDEMGNEFLDCINNVAHVGHSHPVVTETASEQLSQLYTNNRYLHDGLSTYVERLMGLFPSPLEVCFLCNSGSEANDLALLLAKTYTGGTDTITLDGAYHGHLQSCLAISPYKYTKGMSSKPDHVQVAPAPDTYRGIHSDSSQPAHDYAMEVKNLIDVINKRGRKLSSFIMESLQSCGGQVIPPPGYMQEVFRYVRESGGVCIADEVQVGFGRVGTAYWAFQTQDVVPDIVTIGKPMGNGHPVSAVVTTKSIADSLKSVNKHYFNTFGGNPVSCAIANAVLDVIEEEDLVENALKVGKYALEKLNILKRKYQFVGDIRGRGLFIGIDIVKNRQSREPGTEIAVEIRQRMKERFVLLSVDGPYDNVLKFKPPMCFSNNNVNHLVQTLDEVMSTMPDVAPIELKAGGEVLTSATEDFKQNPEPCKIRA